MFLFGLTLLILGIILQPIGWMYFSWLIPASIIAIVLGVIFIFVGRRSTHSVADCSSSSCGGPGDIYGHSGQHSGGRSTSWEEGHSHHDSGGLD